MKAQDHTIEHINFFRHIGVTHIDVRCVDLNNKSDKPKSRLNYLIENASKLFKWLYVMNVRENRNVYIVPSVSIEKHSYIFFDDLMPVDAAPLARKYESLAVKTSEAGGYQLWIRTDEPVRKTERKLIQRYMCDDINSDPCSTDGYHSGRLAGYKNIKRGGNWVNTKPCSGAALFNTRDTLTKPDININADKIIQRHLRRPTFTPSLINPDDAITDALYKIDPDDYDTWVRVGMALHSIDKRDLWNDWSAQSTKYNQRHQSRVWNNFKGSGVTIKSLFYLAQNQ